MPKGYRVEITRSAERDALRIYDYIERDSPVRAAQWFAEIARQIKTRSRLPKRCPVIPEADDIGVEYRHLVSGTYRTIFRIEGTTVWSRASSMALSYSTPRRWRQATNESGRTNGGVDASRSNFLVRTMELERDETRIVR